MNAIEIIIGKDVCKSAIAFARGWMTHSSRESAAKQSCIYSGVNGWKAIILEMYVKSFA